jgi:hypothetical protein
MVMTYVAGMVMTNAGMWSISVNYAEIWYELEGGPFL